MATSEEFKQLLEEQKKTTKTIAKTSLLQLEMEQGGIFQLIKVQEGIAILGTQLNRMLKNMNINRVVDRLKEFSPDPKKMLTAAQAEEADEKKSKEIKKQIDTLKSIDKKSSFLQDIKNGFKNIGKDLFGGIGKTAKRLFQLAGLFGLYKILTDKNLQDLATALDKTVLPALKDLTTFLKDLAVNVATFVIDSIKVFGDPDATFMDKVGASIGLLMLGVIGIYSKSILKYVATFAGAKLLKLTGLTLGALFTPVGAVIVGFIGFFVSIIKGLFESFKVGKETFKKYGFERLDQTINEAGLTFIAEFLGLIPQLIVDGIAFFIGIFNPKLKEKMNKIDVSQYIRETMDNMIESFKMLGEAFTQVVDKLTFGLFLGDERKMVENYDKKLEELQKKRRDAMGMDFTTAADLLAIDEEIEKLKKTKRRVDAYDRESGFDLDMIVGMQKQFYRGGGARAGTIAQIGEGPGGRGGELVYANQNAMVLNQSRTDALLSMALQKGLSGGGGNEAPVVVSTDNSVRSNTSNMMASAPIVTSNDTFTNAIASSV